MGDVQANSMDDLKWAYRLPSIIGFAMILSLLFYARIVGLISNR